MKKTSVRQDVNTWQATNLEQRIMLDGDGAAVATDSIVVAEVAPLPVATENAHAASANLVFVDSDVDDIETLMRGVSDDAEVILLDATTDGIDQITKELAGRRNVASVHVVSHGDAGQIKFAASKLDIDNLERYESQLRSWAAALSADADILIYGCNVSQGQAGQRFISRLASLTGADVAASSDTTGSRRNGADWQFEDQVGEVDARLAFSLAVQQNYQAVLLTVDFESAALGSQGNTYTESGFQFTDGGWGAYDLQVYGASNGYASNVLHPQHYSRTVTVDSADGSAFDLASFDYAAGRFGSTDANVTGYLSDGSTVSSTFASDTKSLATLDLNWTDLDRVVIDFRGGASEVFGALDNFEFGEGGDPTEASISIANTSTQSLSEDAPAATINIVRSGNTQDAVSVNYTTIDGTAIAGQDYTARSGVINFAAGETTSSISVLISDDAESESNESFAFSLSNASAGATIGTASTTITIIDNDSTSTGETIDFETLSVGLQGPSFDTQGYTFEDVGTGNSDLRVYAAGAGYSDNVLHSNNWNRAIRMTKTDGAAFDLASLDFAAGRWNSLTDATVTGNFADGSSATQSFSSSTKTLETLALNWSNLSNVVIDFRGGANSSYGALDNFVVGGSVVEPPQPGAISLTVDAVSFDESTGDLNVVFFRGGGSDGVVTVDYTTVAGTAGNSDFQATSGTMTFADGETGGQIVIPIINDTDVESDETFSVVISNPTGGATLGGITTQTMTILDDDEVVSGIIFEDSFEGSSTWTTNASGTDTATTGMWEATAPQATTSGGTTLQFGSGHTGSRMLVTGGAAGTSVGTFDIDNGVTSVMSPTIALPTGAEIALSFEYYLAYLGNATADDLFSVSILANGVETELFDDHAHNSVLGAAWIDKTIDLSAYAGQSVNIIFKAADAGTGSLVESGVDDVVVEVLPVAPGEINITTTGVNLDESAGNANVTVSRTSGRVGTVTVDYATVAGTAVEGDYTATSGTLTFLDGESEKTISIAINDDTLVESLETFELQLTTPTGGATLGSDSVATITIADDDSTVADYLPDMLPIASTLTESLSIDTTEQPGRELLRFSTEVANTGDGPLEIWGGSISGDSQQVFQRIYQADGGSRDRLAGEFVYHPGHGHIHFEAFATYDLRLTTGNGDIIASGGKTSFCLINIRNPFPDISANAAVTHGRGGNSCGQIQGISTGYSDVYSAGLDDQWIDITDVADGTYWLEIEADPDNNVQELDETNNTARVQVTIANGEVTF